ncbi:MAG TPA: SH3 domain-containing protein [Acidimicrobiia bacterium]|nr:SH3 domain-containing protein [Acidimicrobiia bacterium]
MRSRHAFWAASMTLILAACGGEAASTTTSSPVSSTTPPGATQPSTTIVTTTTSTSGAGRATTTISGTLPGERIDFGPAAGDTVAVIGVAHDDVLNLRAAPGADQRILERIPPLYDSLIALGHTRDLSTSFWIEVEYRGSTGWVNYRYIAFLGETTDVTASVIEALGETPSAATMLELGLIVAESMASEEPESDIVLTSAPEVRDLGEVTYDVIGLGDDAVRGLRLHVFGQRDGGGFTLRTVEMTALCGRGEDGGACV